MRWAVRLLVPLVVAMGVSTGTAAATHNADHSKIDRNYSGRGGEAVEGEGWAADLAAGEAADGAV